MLAVLSCDVYYWTALAFAMTGVRCGLVFPARSYFIPQKVFKFHKYTIKKLLTQMQLARTFVDLRAFYAIIAVTIVTSGFNLA